MKTILMVTWIVFNQPPSSYQVEFDTLAACIAAKNGLFNEAARLKAEGDAYTTRMRATPGIVAYSPIPPPQVTAVCVAK